MSSQSALLYLSAYTAVFFATQNGGVVSGFPSTVRFTFGYMRYCIRSRMGFLSHSHLSLFYHDSGIIKAPIPEAGSDGWRCEGSAGVDIRVHPLPAPSGTTGGQKGRGNPDCYLNTCILELNTHLLMIYAHLFLHNNKAPSCLMHAIIAQP